MVHCRRGRVIASGAQMEEGKALFPNSTGRSVLPDGSFRSSGSSRDAMVTASAFLEMPSKSSIVASSSSQFNQIRPVCPGLPAPS